MSSFDLVGIGKKLHLKKCIHCLGSRQAGINIIMLCCVVFLSKMLLTMSIPSRCFNGFTLGLTKIIVQIVMLRA